jgi:hypothetical protein
MPQTREGAREGRHHQGLPGHSGHELYGGWGNDTLRGGVGCELFWGEWGVDRIEIVAGDQGFGRDTILDFQSLIDDSWEDFIVFKGCFTSFADLRQHATEGIGYISIKWESSVLIIDRLTMRELELAKDHFIFL